MTKGEKELVAGLPYINNVRIIGLTIAINLVLAFVFFFGRTIYFNDLVVDAAICGTTTSLINVFFASYAIRKLRQQKTLPEEVPISKFMQALPKNPFLVAVIFALVFALIMIAVSFLLVRFFNISLLAFEGFLIWKVLYSSVLSAKIMEFAILRFVQPDLRNDEVPEAEPTSNLGSETDTDGQTSKTTTPVEIKNPLPNARTAGNVFNTVINDFGFNIVVGLLLGSVFIVDGRMIIEPTTREGVIVTAIVFGFIVVWRMVYPVAKSMYELRTEGKLPYEGGKNRFLEHVPLSPLKYSSVFILPIMVAAVVFFGLVFYAFQFESLDFLQFFIIRTVFVSLLTKPVVKLTIARYAYRSDSSEPDRS